MVPVFFCITYDISARSTRPYCVMCASIKQINFFHCHFLLIVGYFFDIIFSWATDRRPRDSHYHEMNVSVCYSFVSTRVPIIVFKSSASAIHIHSVFVMCHKLRMLCKLIQLVRNCALLIGENAITIHKSTPRVTVVLAVKDEKTVEDCILPRGVVPLSDYCVPPS